MNNKSHRYFVVAMAAALVAPLASTALAAGSGAGAVMVLNGDGRYVELNADSGRSTESGLYADLPAPQKGMDGSLIEDVRSRDDQTLYALLARDVRADDSGAQRFRIVALDAHTLRVQHSYDLPQPQVALPRLLLDGKHNQLLLLTESGIQTLAIHDDGSFEPSGAAIKAELPLPVSPEPYVDAQGRLVDGFRVFDRQGRLLQEIRPDSVLDASLRDKFDALTRIKESTDHYYGTILAASAGDRMVFTVGWDREDTRIPRAGVVVYDVNAGRTISSFFSEFPVAPGDKGGNGAPSLHLSPDGRRIVIEQYDWLPQEGAPRPGQPSRESRYRTGKLAIYSADNGTLVGTVSLGTASNPRTEGRVAGFSGDASKLYYWFDHRLSVVDLEAAQLLSKAALPEGFDPVAVTGSH